LYQIRRKNITVKKKNVLAIQENKMKEPNREPSNAEVKALIDILFETVEYNQTETSNCIHVISKAIKSIGKRLEMLESHVYNGDDEDEDKNYLN